MKLFILSGVLVSAMAFAYCDYLSTCYEITLPCEAEQYDIAFTAEANFVLKDEYVCNSYREKDAYKRIARAPQSFYSDRYWPDEEMALRDCNKYIRRATKLYKACN